MITVPPVDCNLSSTGLQPITDMVNGEIYQGLTGGLYCNGENERPEPFNNIVLQASSQVIPNPTTLKIDIPFIGDDLGNSLFTGTSHVPLFKQTLKSAVRILNGSNAARHLESWAGVPTDGSGDFVWLSLLNKFIIAGWNPNNIQVAIFGAMPMAPVYFTLSSSDRILYAEDRMIKTFIKTKQYLPNIKLLFVFGGHHYLGYYDGEPYSYDCDFGVQQAIKCQAAFGALACWGNSSWADGINPRTYDGLFWECENFGPGGHLIDGIGNTYLVQRVLLSWLQNDPVADCIRK